MMSLDTAPGGAPLQTPRSRWTGLEGLQLLLRATRAQVLPVILIPILLGAALAWRDVGGLDPWLLLVTMVGGAALHLAANATNDLFDYRRGTDVRARRRDDVVATDSGFLTGGLMTPVQMALLTLALYATAALIAAYLVTVRGWPVAALTAAGISLAVLYVAGPAYGYIGRGLGELGIFCAFGPLPVLGSYFVHAGSFATAATWASVPVGLYATLLLFNHHFLHWRNDRDAGKNNLVALLGARRAAPLSMALLSLVYLALGAAVVAGSLPVWALVALVTSPAPFRATRALLADQGPSVVGALMRATLRGYVRTGVILVVAAVVQAAASSMPWG